MHYSPRGRARHQRLRRRPGGRRGRRQQQQHRRRRTQGANASASAPRAGRPRAARGRGAGARAAHGGGRRSTGVGRAVVASGAGPSRARIRFLLQHRGIRRDFVSAPACTLTVSKRPLPAAAGPRRGKHGAAQPHPPPWPGPTPRARAGHRAARDRGRHLFLNNSAHRLPRTSRHVARGRRGRAVRRAGVSARRARRARRACPRSRPKTIYIPPNPTTQRGVHSVRTSQRRCRVVEQTGATVAGREKSTPAIHPIDCQLPDPENGTRLPGSSAYPSSAAALLRVAAFRGQPFSRGPSAAPPRGLARQLEACSSVPGSSVATSCLN